MKITEVRVFKSDKGGDFKGFASVTFDNSFVVSGLKILEGQNGLFVGMPSQKKPDGTYKDICFPITAELRKEIQQAVLNMYNGEEYTPPVAEETEDEDDSDFFPF